MADTNTETGQQIQLKHQFYALTLCFTVLALAVETADFKCRPLTAAAIELLGWLCLLISGLIGLYRFELVPKLYQFFDAQIRLKHDRSEDGETAELAKVDEEISRRNKRITALYLLHRWLFVAGVVLLVISRGYEPAARILEWVVA